MDLEFENDVSVKQKKEFTFLVTFSEKKPRDKMLFSKLLDTSEYFHNENIYFVNIKIILIQFHSILGKKKYYVENVHNIFEKKA